MRRRVRAVAGLARTALWRRAHWVPIVFLVAGTAAVVVLWATMRNAERSRLRLETQITAEQVRLRLEAWVDARASMVRHLARIGFRDRADLDARFASEARVLLEPYADIQALNFVDPDWVIRIVVPAGTNAPALDQDLHHHPSAGVVAALSRAEATGRLTRTPIIDLLQGGRGFATYLPIRDPAGAVLGYANGVFRIAMLVDSCLAEPKLREGFRFELEGAGSRRAYLHGDPREVGDWPFVASEEVRIVDRPWQLRLAPTPANLARTRTLADELMALGALVLVAGLAFALASLVTRQEALLESRGKYRLLVENQSDMVVKVDLSGRFLYVSPSFCETFGRRERDLLGRDLKQLVPADDRALAERSLRELTRPPHRTYAEQRARTRTGWRWIAWSGTAVFDDSGEVVAAVAVGRDITRQRELEEQLAQSQKLQAIGQLAGGVAHDFNNILQSLMGSYELLKLAAAAGEPLDDELDQIGAGLVRASRVTSQLLAFGRQQVMRRQALEVNAVIRETLQLLRRLLRASVELVFTPTAEPLYTWADRGQLEQVLVNLVVNARDAVGGSGRISIAAVSRPAEVADEGAGSTDPAAGQVGFEVADDGCGMPPEVLRRAFEPFFTTKEVGAGTGLGLATVYGIVRQHGGTVEAASTPGEGSRFLVLLPATRGGSADSEAPATVAAAGGDETVLVAEDDDAVRRVVARQLAAAGYRVVEAVDGREAVALFERRCDDIDVVMLDVVMPGLGGREAAERIRAIRPATPILLASGYDPGPAGSGAEPSARERFLVKPYRLELLLATLRELIDGEPDEPVVRPGGGAVAADPTADAEGGRSSSA